MGGASVVCFLESKVRVGRSSFLTIAIVGKEEF